VVAEGWSVVGTVVHGERRGRAIGFPTANLDLPHEVPLPWDGIYAGVVREVGGSGLFRGAAISIGTNPTFNGQRRTVEAHLLDYDGDLYGCRLELQCLCRLREMRRFADVSELIVAMERDVAAARRVIVQTHPEALGHEYMYVSTEFDW